MPGPLSRPTYTKNKPPPSSNAKATPMATDPANAAPALKPVRAMDWEKGVFVFDMSCIPMCNDADHARRNSLIDGPFQDLGHDAAGKAPRHQKAHLLAALFGVERYGIEAAPPNVAGAGQLGVLQPSDGLRDCF